MFGLGWKDLVLVAVFALAAIFTVASIGNKREPYTPASAVATLILNAFLIWLVVSR